MENKLLIANSRGFSLIEILAVMVILGVMGSVGFHKFDVLSITAGKAAVREGVKELNTREKLTWVLVKLSNKGWISDAIVWKKMDIHLGSHYDWSPVANSDGGSLYFKSQNVKLNRKYSSSTSSGYWELDKNT